MLNCYFKEKILLFILELTKHFTDEVQIILLLWHTTLTTSHIKRFSWLTLHFREIADVFIYSKNFNIVFFERLFQWYLLIFSLMVLSTELHTWMPLSLTLIKFQVHSGMSNIKLVFASGVQTYVCWHDHEENAFSNFDVYLRKITDAFPALI